MLNIKASLLLVLVCCACISNIAFADWFLSSEIKELISQANAGDSASQFLVGAAYDSGHGAPHDKDEALKWYLMAANAGFAKAQNSAGSLLQAEEKYSEALPWYEKAADQGDPLATNNLAYFYDLGLGVKQDRQKAFEIYSKAADLGWAEAMWNIANMYGAGQLGKIDLVAACVWTFRANMYATDQDKILKARLNSFIPGLLKTLTPEQVDSCNQQLDDAIWKPNPTQ